MTTQACFAIFTRARVILPVTLVPDQLTLNVSYVWLMQRGTVLQEFVNVLTIGKVQIVVIGNLSVEPTVSYVILLMTLPVSLINAPNAHQIML